MIRAAEPEDFVLHVANKHTSRAPQIQTATREARYVGYFENSYGEQWLLIVNRERKSGRLYGGDW